MENHVQTPSSRVLVGDCRSVLADLPDESVHCCVTSPPYWQLRDYGLPASVWGGKIGCSHAWTPDREGFGEYCSCGAWRGQLGLEPTPDLYVEHLVEVFRAVRRILRRDGTLWLVIGDCFAKSGRQNGPQAGKGTKEDQLQAPKRSRHAPGLKQKDLVGIPWRVALALQADGWYLRSDIVWSKPNPMPESVTDRPTRSHEYVFLLAKSKRYYYDYKAIMEPIAASTRKRCRATIRSGAAFDPERHKHGLGIQNPTELRVRASPGVLARGRRNRRTVWTIPTRGYRGLHFATFPPRLVEPCILAGTSATACRSCGTPRGARWSCACNAGVEPCVVLDPFAGAGTTGLVAGRLGRNFVGIDLNPKYVEMAKARMRQHEPEAR